MNRTLIATVLLIAAAAWFASRLGGVVGAGVALGGLGGASAASVGVLLQYKIAKTAPKRLFSAMVVGFLLKMFTALAGAIAFRYVPAAAARCDWESFLLAFATCAVGVMMVGILDLMRAGALGRSLKLDGGEA